MTASPTLSTLNLLAGLPGVTAVAYSSPGTYLVYRDSGEERISVSLVSRGSWSWVVIDDEDDVLSSGIFDDRDVLLAAVARWATPA